MKTYIIISFIVLSGVFYSCSKTTSPTGPQFPNPGLVLSLDGYGITLDSTYYKVWSDSSWEEFYADSTIDGTTYSVILDDGGNEYYYGPSGYAGFRLYGDTLILFDSSMASLPDTVTEGTTYTRQTTFTYQGSSNVITDQETVLDTSTVMTSFGMFTGCRVLQSAVWINGALQYVTVYWLAKGPSDVAREYDTGYTILMAYGVVNGQGWGVNTGRALPGAADLASAASRVNQPSSVARAVSDLHTLAARIGKGILR